MIGTATDDRGRRTTGRGPGDRGVTDLVAFVLSFSIIMISIGLLYAGGFGALNDLQDEEQTENAEQVFLAVSDSFSELQEGQAPKRAGALDLDVGATISVVNRSSINVTVNGAGFAEEFRTRSLEYTLEGTTVAYENGAVFRADGGKSVMIGEPPELYCSNETSVAVVSVVTLTAPKDPSLAAGTATITGIQRSTTLEFPDNRTGAAVSSVENVSVNVTSSHEGAWNGHFDDASNDWVNPDNDDTFTCEGVDRAFVRHTVIEVRIVH